MKKSYFKPGLIVVLLPVLLSSCNKSQPSKDQTPNFEVVAENIDFREIEITENHGSSDGPLYFSYSEIEETYIPEKTIVFKGEKTGESRQIKECIIKEINCYEYYTDSKVKVTECYYGDIMPGDVVVLREYYHVTQDEAGTKILMYSNKLPSHGETMYTLYYCDEKSAYGDGYYYMTGGATGAVNIAEFEKQYDAHIGDPENVPINDIVADFYKKYVVDGDTALDEAKELEKALDWKKEYESRLALLGESEKSEEEIEKMTLSDEESAKIKELVKRYNDLSKQ